MRQEITLVYFTSNIRILNHYEAFGRREEFCLCMKIPGKIPCLQRQIGWLVDLLELQWCGWGGGCCNANLIAVSLQLFLTPWIAILSPPVCRCVGPTLWLTNENISVCINSTKPRQRQLHFFFNHSCFVCRNLGYILKGLFPWGSELPRNTQDGPGNGGSCRSAPSAGKRSFLLRLKIPWWGTEIKTKSKAGKGAEVSNICLLLPSL